MRMVHKLSTREKDKVKQTDKTVNQSKAQVLRIREGILPGLYFLLVVIDREQNIHHYNYALIGKERRGSENKMIITFSTEKRDF